MRVAILKGRCPVRNQHCCLPILGEAGPGRREPAGVASLDLQPHRLAGQQRRRYRLCRFRVGDAPAGRRIVEAETQAQVAGGGDRGNAAGRLGDGAGQTIGAVMTAQQRHGRASILGDGDDRRLAALVGEQRRHGADQDAGGAYADDRRAGGEQRAQVRHRILEHHVRAFRATGQPMHPALRQQRL